MTGNILKLSTPGKKKNKTKKQQQQKKKQNKKKKNSRLHFGKFSCFSQKIGFASAVVNYFCNCMHYEIMPIQIYWNFYHQKMKIFR